MARTWKLLALLLALSAGPAGAQEPHRGLTLSAGIDARTWYDYWYFYPGGYSELDATTVALAVEAGWDVPLGPRGWIAPSLGLGVGRASGTFSASGEPGQGASGLGWQARLFAEGGYRLTDRLAGLARLGVGLTTVSVDQAEDSSTDLLGAVGLRLELTPGLAVAFLYELTLANLAASTDAGVTSAEPSLESLTNRGFQARLQLRF